MRTHECATNYLYEERSRTAPRYEYDGAGTRWQNAYFAAVLCREPKIANVIFNPPATVVFWSDGTKTVVKAQNGEPFDPEKGLAMAVTKKFFGNRGRYFDEVKKWRETFRPEKEGGALMEALNK